MSDRTDYLLLAVLLVAVAIWASVSGEFPALSTLFALVGLVPGVAVFLPVFPGE
ncbi:hypothetical protein NDI76_10910 [Halogeometricum sp. S1BR25-6]|uniref:Uncharacterized protein n=1 Tax=Halogeometricum salsisoli TaxID=2950536 RepID=A0ABU2GEK9_9EURY|nr:hypothetical protein [Halogeometricum sp. S1BR25-6]MDS0299250.1 hypothetical protein [Halogeometricum sp. S1BR25-6]